jgi:hypothetical protein
MLAYCKEMLEYQNGMVAIHPSNIIMNPISKYESVIPACDLLLASRLESEEPKG